MNYATVCSGIEAPSVAWSDLGWKASWFSEIEAPQCAVLKHHYPDVPNLGDLTKITAEEVNQYGRLDILTSGLPCQSYSNAKSGNRKGMDDPRGNLARFYFDLIGGLDVRPRVLIFENVPGIMSTNGGRDFGAILGTLDELGYGYAWRVLDAQNHRGSTTRRKRLWLVAHHGGLWQYPAAVLFGGDKNVEVLRPEQTQRDHLPAFTRPGGGLSLERLSGCVYDGVRARKLTPDEYEQCMGFPKGYTAVCGASDSQRWGMVGNSMAVPTLRMLGQRIQFLEKLSTAEVLGDLV